MATEFARNTRKAKNKALRFDTQGFTNVFEITASSSGGTIAAATSAASLNVTLNGTSYKIPLFT